MTGVGTLVPVDLSPLQPADARSIARRFIDVAAFADQCVERAGGNPLFLEQLLRGARDLTDSQAILFRQDQAIALAARGLAVAGQASDTFDLAMLVGDFRLDAGRGTEAIEAH